MYYVCRGETVPVFLDHLCDDVVERLFLDPIVFFDRGRHASWSYINCLMRVLTFFPCDDRFLGVSSEFFFVFLEDERLVFRPCNNDIIVGWFWRDGYG